MKLKKIGVLLVAAAFVVSVGAGTADAAKGGGRISAPKVSAPKAAAPKAVKPETSAAKKDSPNTKEYSPSKKADQYKESAPAAKSAAPGTASNAAAAAQKSTGWGSALRTVGMLAGGMMLGSMLSHLFGFGGAGMFADIMGLVMNLLMAVVVIYLVKMFISWFMKKKQADNAGTSYRESAPIRDRYTGEAHPVQDIRPPKTIEAEPIQDIKPPAAESVRDISAAASSGWDYDPHTAAEKYRRM